MARTRAVERRSIDRLPSEALEAVLTRLPADARARAACVSRAWRAAAACPLLWETLDLTRAGGLTCTLGPAAILNSPSLAPRLAHVRTLRLPAGPDAPLEALRAVLRLLRDKTLSSSLTLRLDGTLKPRSLAIDSANYGALLGALTKEPALTLITLDTLHCTTTELGAAVFTLPRLSVAHVILESSLQHAAAPVERLLSALECYTPLATLTVFYVDFTTRELSRIVDVALARSLQKLEIIGDCLYDDSLPVLGRLLRSSTSLRSLSFRPEDVGQYDDDVQPPYSAANVALFADALRNNTSLKYLALRGLGSAWHCAAPAVCAALAGHSSLESLLISESISGDLAPLDLSTVDAALAEMLNADAPALKRLEVNLDVKADGQLPLTLPLTFAGVARNKHLRALKVGPLESSNAMLRRSVLPAMQANTGLIEALIVLDGGMRDVSDATLNQLHAAMRHMTPFERQHDVF